MDEKSSIPKGKSVKRAFKSFFVTIIIMFFLFAGLFGGVIAAYIRTADLITSEELMLKGYTTQLFDNNEKVLSPLMTDKNREMVNIQDVPQYLKDAYIAIEDKRFYDHKGVDLKRIASAALTFLKPGASSHGGSTITQQVIKNITGETERSLKRKIQEQWKAIELEKHLTKDQILDIYMNIIYMGNGCYGVQSASKLYFNKPVNELTLAQCASLAGITNAPSVYDPFTTKGKENFLKRKDIILKEMLSIDAITKAQYEYALTQDLHLAPKRVLSNSGHIQPYYVDKVVLDVKKALIEKGYSEDIAIKMIYNNGFKIYTTIDAKVQASLDEIYTNMNYFRKVNYAAKGIPQSAMVILDTRTGQVRGLYGGSGAKPGAVLNRACDPQVKRQPGSTFKPIAVYGPAINERLITAASIFDDVAIHLNGANKPAYPKNYDNTYGGLTSIRDALKRSINVVAAKVWTMKKKFPDISHQYLRKVNIDRDDENYVSVALGGLENGVNVMQMAAAYVPFANKGLYYEPITFTKVIDSNGKVILEKNPDSNIVYDEETSSIMTSMLQGVVQPGGTAYPYGQIGSIPTAGKTGTTSENKDKWFVGYSPYYVGATWYGYDTPTTLTSAEYSRAQQIWHDVMVKAHQGLAPASFGVSSSLIRKNICIYSGKIASSLCSSDPRGNAVREELFIPGTEPDSSSICDVHESHLFCSVHKDAWGRNILAGNDVPPSDVISKVVISRQQPFASVDRDDPYPTDWIYGYWEGEYCPYHEKPASIIPKKKTKKTKKVPTLETTPP